VSKVSHSQKSEEGHQEGIPSLKFVEGNMSNYDKAVKELTQAAEDRQKEEQSKIEPKRLTIKPSELDLEVAGKNGIRITSNGSARGTKIMVRDEGEWKELKYVRGVKVSLDVNDDDGIPRVELTYFILPETKHG
jgi:hypothetical protein